MSPTRQDAHREWIRLARGQFDQAAPAGLLASESGHIAASSFPGYELEAELHRGGQGVVYAAVQRSTGRRVALKVLREWAFAGPLDRARFEREVQVLAALRHPNIVTIHDSGSAAGRFYFVMDFIAGEPLAAYIARGPHPLRETLQLFAQICEGVDAAHLLGIIHRDIKPGNVRIDTGGKPYVLDFGLAKLVDSSSHRPAGDPAAGDTRLAGATMTGQFLGSLPWAAPEQAEGSPTRIDARTDVYALGVLLFQMLTGRFPYPVSGGMRTVLEHIVTTAPARPRTLRRELNDEVETIVLKCLSKERERRYRTAGELARDVRRYLGNEPIAAKRESRLYLLRKSLSRHRTVVTVTALVAAIVVAAGVVSFALWRQAVHDRDAAFAAGLREELARSRADAEAGVANAVTAFLQSMLASAEPAVTQGRRDLSVHEALDWAAAEIERGTLTHQPRVEAAVRFTLGRAYLSLGRLEVAERHLDAARAFAQREQPLGKPHAEALRWLGVLARRRDQLGAAERLQRQALKVYRQLEPPDPEYAGHCVGELALVVSLLGRDEEATELTRAALELYRRALGPAHGLVASMESVLSARVHDHVEALELAQRSLTALQAHYGEKHPQVVDALTRVGGARLASGDLTGAIEATEQALALMREVHGDENPVTLECVAELSFLYGMRADGEASLALLEEFLAAADVTHGPCNEIHLRYLITSAQSCAHDPAAAERAYRAILESPECPEWSTSIYGGRAQLGLSELLLERGACEAAAVVLLAFQAVADDNPGRSSPASIGRYQCLWGEVLTCRGEFAAAETALLEASDRLSASRLAAESHRQRATRALVRLYEAWELEEPGMGNAAKALNWRARLAPVP